MLQPSLEEEIQKVASVLNTLVKVLAPYVDDTVLAAQRSLKGRDSTEENPGVMTHSGRVFAKRANAAGGVLTTAADELLPKIYFATKRLTRLDQMIDEASKRPIDTQTANKPKERA